MAAVEEKKTEHGQSPGVGVANGVTHDGVTVVETADSSVDDSSPGCLLLDLAFRKAGGREGSPFEASTTACSDEQPLSPIAESGGRKRLATVFGWGGKKKKESLTSDSVDLQHQRRPSKSRFRWTMGKKKEPAQVPLARNIGGGSKANIDNVFAELTTATTEERAPRPSIIVASRDAEALAARVAGETAEATPAHSTSASLLRLQTSIKGKHPASAKKMAKTPKLELENDKDWIVEHYKDSKEVIKIEGARMNQNLQIRAVENSTIQVADKVNNVVIESCKRTNVVLAGLISSIEVIHCDRLKLQVLGKCPSVNMDNCSGVNLYVSNAGKDVVITASKSSDMNVSFPIDDDEEEYVECPIPQQFVHTIGADQKVESKVSDLYR